jgi:hypothetical protein
LPSASVQVDRTSRLRRACAAAVALAPILLWPGGCTPSDTSAGSAGAPARDLVESVKERGPVRLSVRVSPREITVGDKLTLTLQVEAPEAVEVEMPQFSETIGPFEIRAARTPPDIPEGEVRRWTHRYTLDTFASGKLEIPSLTVDFVDRRPETLEEGSPVEGELGSDPLIITVRSVLTGDEQEGDFRDIQEAVEVPIPIDWRAYWPVAAAILAIGAVVLFILWRARRENSRLAAEKIIPPHLWALSQLDALARESLPEEGRFHEFYFRLSDIVRQYVERRFGLRAPERTTEEFLRETRDDPLLSDDQKNLLAGFLRAADMVKFARHEPAVEECETAFAAARGFIEQTAPAPSVVREIGSGNAGAEAAA